ncbi:MAG: hypothetical protein ACREDO_07050 [Methyloceanibacter sp.]
MRILLILIIIAAIFAVVQNQRHGCEWGKPDWQGWFDCVIGKSASTTVPTTAPAAPEGPSAPETPPAPATPQ